MLLNGHKKGVRNSIAEGTHTHEKKALSRRCGLFRKNTKGFHLKNKEEKVKRYENEYFTLDFFQLLPSTRAAAERNKKK